MYTHKALNDLAALYRSKLPDDTGVAQTVLTLIAELRLSRKAMIDGAVPLEVLAGIIRTKGYTELGPDLQKGILDAVTSIRAALESHDTAFAIADPNMGLEYCDKDHEAFEGDVLREYFECQCHSDEHFFKFTLDPRDGDFYLSVHLSNYKGFFQRLWAGLKYAFGYKSKYGAFDEVTMDVRTVERLHRLTNEALDHMNSAAAKMVAHPDPIPDRKEQIAKAAANARARLEEKDQLVDALAAVLAVKEAVNESTKKPRKPRKKAESKTSS